MSQTPDDEAFELLSSPPAAPDLAPELKARRGAGLPKSTLGLIGALLLVGSFVGGIAVGKANASNSGGTARAGSANPAAPGPGATATRGARGGFGAGGGGVVTGTVQSVDGTTIYVTDATGKTTKVDTGASTTITVSKTGALSDLTPGSRVTVVGAAGSDGTVTARSVVSGTAIGGFGAGGRGGGLGGPGGPTATPTG